MSCNTHYSLVLCSCFLALKQANFQNEWINHTSLWCLQTKSLRDPNVICATLVSLWPSQQFQLLPQLFGQRIQPHLGFCQSHSEFSHGCDIMSQSGCDIHNKTSTSLAWQRSIQHLPSEIQQSPLHVPWCKVEIVINNGSLSPPTFISECLRQHTDFGWRRKCWTWSKRRYE